MTSPNLFQIAEANGVDFPRRVQGRLQPLSDEQRQRLAAFGRMVEERGCISINMKGWKLGAFLDRGRYLSVQEAAEEEAAKSGTTAEQVLRVRQDKFYERRMAFETHFEDGRRFLYGAPNIGGIGISYYGKYAIVLGEETTQGLQVAHLPADSVQAYVPEVARPVVDEARVLQDVAPPSHLHSMAILKHADDACRTDEPRWPSMLCSDAGYCESIFVGDVKPFDVREFRIETKEMERFADLLLEKQLGRLSPADETELLRFFENMKKLDDYGIRSRLVEV